MRPNVQLLGTAVLLALSQLAVAQPPPPGGAGGPGAGGPGGPMGGTDSVAGQSSSTACPTSATTCAADGSTNYIDRSKLAFDAKTGLFSGSITFNGCPKHKTGPTLSPSCVQQTLPAVTTTPVASALRGAVGYTIYGVNIYGPYEAGFQAGFVCTNGTCDGGIDVPTCRSKLARDCGGVSQLKEEMLHDDCAGHATPYHHHLDLPCDYDITAAGAHSQLVGWALDGRGIYGRWESDGKTPTDLDACNGHYGPVPAITLGGGEYPHRTQLCVFLNASIASYLPRGLQRLPLPSNRRRPVHPRVLWSRYFPLRLQIPLLNLWHRELHHLHHER